MHDRRARPTVRVLREDLTDGWESAWVQRTLTGPALTGLHPVSELPHPLVRKAAESFGNDATDDTYVGRIAACRSVSLLEIKVGQWRGGVWIDEEQGVAWLVAGGLAKGNHKDHDDFYERLARLDQAGRATSLLPTSIDQTLLKRETAARLLTAWEQSIQRQVLDALQTITSGGTVRFGVDHPNGARGEIAVVEVAIDPVRERDYQSDDITVKIVGDHQYRGSDLLWSLTTRILVSLHPPEQGWDRYQDTFSNISDPGTWDHRVCELRSLVTAGELAESVPGQYAHYSHRRHLADAAVNGESVRALCGRFFVPLQDNEELPCCPECEQRMAHLPG